MLKVELKDDLYFAVTGGTEVPQRRRKTISQSCFESKFSDLELLKCWAALSECTQSVVIIRASKRGTPFNVCFLR
jgi:hypothetical protein